MIITRSCTPYPTDCSLYRISNFHNKVNFGNIYFFSQNVSANITYRIWRSYKNLIFMTFCKMQFMAQKVFNPFRLIVPCLDTLETTFFHQNFQIVIFNLFQLQKIKEFFIFFIRKYKQQNTFLYGLPRLGTLSRKGLKQIL